MAEYTREQLMTVLRKADAAGDTATAKIAARRLKDMDTAPEPVQQEQEQEVSQGASFKEGFTQGASFGFKDEIVASTDAGKAFLADSMADAVEHSMGGGENPQYSAGEAYNRRKAYEDAYRRKLMNQNPMTYYAGEITGTIAGTMASFGIGAALAPARFANLGIKGAALVEAGLGAVQGLGHSEEETIAGMAKDMAVGSALAAGGEVVGRGAYALRMAAKEKAIMPRFLRFLGMSEEQAAEQLKGNKPVGEWTKRVLGYKDEAGKPLVDVLHTKKEMLSHINMHARKEGRNMGSIISKIDESAPIDNNDIQSLYQSIDGLFEGKNGFLDNVIDPKLEQEVMTLRENVYNTLYTPKRYDPKTKELLNPFEPKEKLSMSNMHQWNSMAWDDLINAKKTNANAASKRIASNKVEIAKKMSSFIDDHIKKSEDVLDQDMFGDYSMSRMKYGDLIELRDSVYQSMKRSPAKQYLNNMFTKAVVGYGSAGYLLSEQMGLPSKEASLAAAGLLAISASPRVNLAMAKLAKKTAESMKKHADVAAPIAGKLLASASTGSENFYEQLQLAGAHMELIDNPLARTSDEVMRRKDVLLTFMENTNPAVAGNLRTAIEEGNQGAIAEIMSQVVMKAPKGLIKSGLGWDGRAVTPEDKEAVTEWINGLSSTRERMNTKTQFEKDSQIPIKMFAPEKREVINQFIHPKVNRKPGKPSL